MTPLAGWQNFYVIVGSSAGALIGLQFVVLSLITDRRLARTDADAGSAFATPQIVHFVAVLGLSGILAAPWDAVTAPAVLLGLAGLSGIVFTIVVTRRMRTQSAYRPQFEDWVFHVVLPLVAYTLLAGSACAAPFRLRDALFGVGTAAMLLLFAGIHNAWDAVTWHVFVRSADTERER
jgi:hypothetical protein